MALPATIPPGATQHQVLSPAMWITEPEEARVYFEMVLSYSMTLSNLPKETLETNLREQIGYYAGYYSREIRARVERLFGAVHPVFGPVVDKPLQPASLIAAGMHVAEEVRKGATVSEAMASARKKGLSHV